MKMIVRKTELQLDDRIYNSFATKLYPIAEEECVYYAETALNETFDNLLKSGRKKDIEDAINKAMLEEASI